ncbi:MAG: VCBS repeat-containing protein [Planctomycetota bacterium]|nr:VCBS repeat-containing protein [Planctomycetota bacterium]
MNPLPEHFSPWQSAPLQALCLGLIIGVGACNHAPDPEGEIALGPPLSVSGAARYRDMNTNGQADAGDEVILTFNVPLKLNSSDPAALALPVPGDGLGQGASMAAGPGNNDLTLILGANPVLRARGVDLIASLPGSSSRLETAEDIPAGAIQNRNTGRDLGPMPAVDLAPMHLKAPKPEGLYSSAHFILTDLNGDGMQDIAAADGFEGLDIYQGLPQGGFQRQEMFLESSLRVAVGDILGQGRQDILILTDLNLHLVYNNSSAGGPIQLKQGGAFPVPSPATDLALLDADGDGDLDIALSTQAGIFIVRNDGGGALNPSGQPLEESRTWGSSLIARDINLDGVVDLFVSTATGTPDQVLLADGCGNFVPKSLFDTGDHRRVQIADLDGDGRLDFVLAGEQSQVQVFRDAGNLSYQELPGLTSATGRVSCIGLLDIDLDGRLDLMYCDGGILRSFLGDGAGGFQDLKSGLGSGNLHQMVATDWDADGDADLLSTSTTAAQLWIGSGAGAFGSLNFATPPLALGLGPVSAQASGDLTGDGRTDVLIARNNTLEMHANTGAGTFASPKVVSLGSAVARDLILVDLDLDGDLDVAAAIEGTAPHTWLNNGWGILIPEGPSLARLEQCVAAGPLNSDAYPELVFAVSDSSAHLIELNLGLDCWAQGGPGWRGMTAAMALPTSGPASTLHLGDVDMDGDLDLLLGRGLNQPDELLLNNGYGGFSPMNGTFPPGTTADLALADVNQDGAPDVLVASTDGLLLFTNEGSGTFAYTNTLDLTSFARADLLELNGDGWCDALAIDTLTDTLQVWFGTPDGVFSQAASWSTTLTGLSTSEWLDADGDGGLDLFLGVDDESANRLLLTY